MPVIDMSTLKPVGEFGSRAWGEACAECSIKILEAANLPSSITWAFSEDYTHPPAAEDTVTKSAVARFKKATHCSSRELAAIRLASLPPFDRTGAVRHGS